MLLSLAVAGAICSMLLNLGQESAKDYTFACFFLICTTLLLRLRWVVGTSILALSLLVLYGARLGGAAWPSVLPADADVHLTVAWATGGVLSYMIESQKRYMALNPCNGVHPAWMRSGLGKRCLFQELTGINVHCDLLSGCPFKCLFAPKEHCVLAGKMSTFHGGHN